MAHTAWVLCESVLGSPGVNGRGEHMFHVRTGNQENV